MSGNWTGKLPDYRSAILSVVTLKPTSSTTKDIFVFISVTNRLCSMLHLWFEQISSNANNILPVVGSWSLVVRGVCAFAVCLSYFIPGNKFILYNTTQTIGKQKSVSIFQEDIFTMQSNLKLTHESCRIEEKKKWNMNRALLLHTNGRRITIEAVQCTS